MKVVICMPFIYRPYARECIDTMHKDFSAQLMAVDNTEYNNGIMRSHNLGIDEMNRVGAEWLVVMSAAVRFGKYSGGMDFLSELEEHSGNKVIEAAGVNGWHLIAFRKEVIDAVGRWDENFTPYGYDDLDYSYRIQKAFPDDPQLWTKVNVNVSDMGMAHGIKLAGVESDNERLRTYYRSKWGILPEEDHQNAFDLPFNDATHSLRYWQPHFDTGGWEGLHS